MKKIVLISCVSKKLDYKTKTKYLYISNWFKKAFKYSERLGADKIFVLSAKYGLLDLDTEIEPYDETLKNKSAKDRKLWAEKVITQLKKEIDLKNDEIIFLAGKKYREYIIPEIRNYKIPLEGLKIGQQGHFLKEAVK